MDFQDKVVIITGAANGIGRGIAQEYAKKSAIIVLADLDIEAGKEVEKELKEKGTKALFVQTDVSKDVDIVHLISKTMEQFQRLDILINNAGITKFQSPYDLSIEDWDLVINTNLRSVFLGSREAAKHMRENGGGAIVNIASTRSAMSEPNSEAYAASKGGIVAITHALAASLSEDMITVNAISPGWIETGDYSSLREKDHEQHLSKRVGKPSDIAKACLYLTDSENDFVTGTNLIIDGGMTRKMIYEG
ncbi:glucose 1-dehydrogenase [Sutcliffiella deserti]|uniref:glucose 1-dehydrogenase n=1 Tax=Sutcliffiella deserti TaxID=2875501 RepID=UPI001CBF3975|nr:glucose 1-dehydrogenase [Sutcliffiella deserti]